MKEYSENERLLNEDDKQKAPLQPSSPDDNSKAALASAIPDVDALFSGFVEKYSTPLLRLCFMYLKNRENAEDAVQETFVKVYKNLEASNIFSAGKEKAWINTIAVNTCRDMLRSAWFKRVNLTDEMNNIPCEDYVAADDTLIKEVMQLKQKYLEVILLFYYEDMKISDIAQVLRVPESTVSVRLMRAKAQLKVKLGGWYYE